MNENDAHEYMERKRRAIPIDYNESSTKSKLIHEACFSSLRDEIVTVDGDDSDDCNDSVQAVSEPDVTNEGNEVDELDAAIEHVELNDDTGVAESDAAIENIEMNEVDNEVDELDATIEHVELNDGTEVAELDAESHGKPIIGCKIDSVFPSTSAAARSAESDFSSLRIKLEEQILYDRATIRKLNERIGVEKIEDDSDGEQEVNVTFEEERFSDTDEENLQYDPGFAKKYGFTTNVSWIVQYFVCRYKMQYKKILCILFTIFQSNADRFYLNGRIKISVKNVDLFKKWNSTYPHSQLDHDSGFVTYLLTIVFDIETLRRSSALGRKPTNGKPAHDALDCEILQFVRGMSIFALTIHRNDTHVEYTR